jgi:predicted metal-dependent HD superfamily phosphohydrolase
MATPSLRRFQAVCKGLGANSDPVTLYDDLIRAYSEPHRAYHTVVHLESCLREFDAARQLAEAPYAIEAALWFHDAIYDTHRSDNEERSASWASSALSALGVSASRAKRVGQLVLATCHHEAGNDADTALLLDVDLSILGTRPENFDRYEAEVRREYAWVSDADFRHGRRAILEKLRDRKRIYQTDFFHDRYEAQARANLTRSLVKLRGEGVG